MRGRSARSLFTIAAIFAGALVLGASSLAAQSSIVNGVVSDGSGGGFPLYAQLEITGPGFSATIFNDPVSGYYSISLPDGATYHFVVTSQIPGYNPGSADVDVNLPVAEDPPGIVANFALTVDAGLCIAPGYTPGPPGPVEFSEAFDGGVLPAGWSVINNSGSGVGWLVQTDFAPCFEMSGNPTGGTGAFALVNSDCDGFVFLDEEMRSVSFDLSAVGGAVLTFSQEYFNLGDTADVDVTVDGGATWTNVLRQTASDRGPTSISAVLPGVGGQSSVQLRWHYYNAFFAWWWAVDDIVVNSATCFPGSGGLVVGTVSDGNTGAGLNGATVQNMPDGETATTHGTPLDPNVGEGFYSVFAGSGPQPFQASDGAYQPETLTTNVIPNSTVRLDFSLAAGWLSASPSNLSAKVLPGDTEDLELDITNVGNAAGHFEILESSTPVSDATAHHGPFASETLRRRALQRVGSKANYFGVTGKNLPPMVGAPVKAKPKFPFAAGDVLASYPSGNVYDWGVAYDGAANATWISNLGVAGGDDKAYQYLADGTKTGDTITLPPGAPVAFTADGTYNANTGMMWYVNTNGCIFEADPASETLTGNQICPSFATSERGLAYDFTTDTYYAGSWLDFTIVHFDSSGNILDSAFTGLGISGLAFYPATGHLFVQVSDPVDFSISVLDVNNGYEVVGNFTVSDGAFDDHGGSGMETDCEGNLWAVNQFSQVIFKIASGEGSTCSQDVPWLSENPTEGTVPAGAGPGNPFPVTVTFDSAGLFPGLRQASLHFQTDTPYPMAPVGVDFTVRFLDVLENNPPGTDTFENFIYAAAGANIMHGCSFFNFCPHDLVTRADMAGYIWRAVHGPFAAPPAYTGGFQDVFFGDYNADYIQGVFDDGITAGCQAAPPLFCPGQSIPRGQMAVFIEKGTRGPDYIPPACSGIFGDVACPPTPSDPYGDWVEVLFNDGITSGCQTSPPKFCPLDPIPNEQMAVFIVKAFDLPVLP